VSINEGDTVTNTALPWNDDRAEALVLDAIMRAPRIPLDEPAPVGPGPGCYAHFLRDIPALGALGDGRYPVYVGSSVDLLDRRRRHVRNFSSVPALEGRIVAAYLPLTRYAWALAAEDLLCSRLKPLLNGSAWGSKVPGSNRTQPPGFADALFPGRAWSLVPSLVDRADAQLRAVGYLARLDPAGPRWPTISDGEGDPLRERA
jgi:hypothetical protein